MLNPQVHFFFHFSISELMQQQHHILASYIHSFISLLFIYFTTSALPDQQRHVFFLFSINIPIQTLSTNNYIFVFDFALWLLLPLKTFAL